MALAHPLKQEFIIVFALNYYELLINKNHFISSNFYCLITKQKDLCTELNHQSMHYCENG